MRGLLGSAYRRASAVSAGLCEFRERLQNPSSLAPFVFSDTTGKDRRGFGLVRMPQRLLVPRRSSLACN